MFMKVFTEVCSMKRVWLAVFSIFTLTSCVRKPQTPVSYDYHVMTVACTDATVTERYSASVKGSQNVEIRPQVSGQITKICINEGAAVRKGVPMFIIDQVPYTSALETAKANVESAKAKLATAQMAVESKQVLCDQQVVSDFDLQTAQNTLREVQAGLAQAQAAEVNARNNLSYTIIRSPVDGVASMIPYKVGALVNPSISTPLTTVSNDDEMYAYFSITEKQMQNMIQTYGTLEKMLQALPEVRLLLSNGAEYRHVGRIDAVSGTVDVRTGTVIMRATFANPDKLLMNGGVATILITHRRKDCIVIPQSATFEVQNKRFAYKVVNGKAESVAIETTSSNGGKEFIVTSGLEIGDVIIAEGAGLVREGSPVNINNK